MSTMSGAHHSVVQSAVPKQIAADAARSVDSSSTTIMLIAALVGGALAFLLVRTITRAVRQVLDAAQGIAEGDLDALVGRFTLTA